MMKTVFINAAFLLKWVTRFGKYTEQKQTRSISSSKRLLSITFSLKHYVASWGHFKDLGKHFTYLE